MDRISKLSKLQYGVSLMHKKYWEVLKEATKSCDDLLLPGDMVTYNGGKKAKVVTVNFGLAVLDNQDCTTIAELETVNGVKL